MFTRSTFTLTSLAIVAACGGGGENNPQPDAAVKDIGFNKPTAPLMANEEVDGNYVERGAADLSCLGTPANDPPTTVPVTIQTEVRDFQSENLVPGAVVTVFQEQNINSPMDTKTADGDAKVSVTLTVGTKRFGYKMTHPSQMDTLLLNQTAAPDMMVQMEPSIRSVSKTTAQTLPALIGVSRTPGTGVLAGALYDCQKRTVSNFIATVSTTKGTVTHAPGADTYYFDDAIGLPVRHNQRQASSKDGLFMVIELQPAASAFVQVWGYKTQADVDADNLSLIAELEAPVIADTVITGSYEPLRQ